VSSLRTWRQFAKRFASIVVAVVVTGAMADIILLPGVASAGQVSSRSITISSSVPSATSVTYAVSFKPTSTATIGGIVVDFCSDSPLIGSTTCAYPSSFTMGSTPSVSGLAGFSTSTGSWVTTNSLQGGAASSNTQVLLYTNTTAQTPTGTSTAITFNITGVTNPSTTGSFYARILTFDTSAHTTAQYTASGTTRASSFANMLDYGGVALSTVTNINITSKVYETLSFCIYLAGGTACTTAPNLTLGDPTTGALSSASVYADDGTGNNTQSGAAYQIATNDGSGVVVTMTGTTLCRPGGTCTTGASAYTISSEYTYNSNTNTEVALVAGSEAFGMCADTTSGNGGLAASAPYNDTTNNCHNLASVTTNNVYSGASKFGFYDVATSGGTNSAGGSTVLTSTGAVSTYTGQFDFAATIAAATEAGIYTTSLNLVATGTF
jgi:hypothetical protein